MLLTIPNLPEKVDSALRERAKIEGKSLDQIALEALTAYASTPLDKPKRDLSFMGKMSAEDARSIEEAHEFCDQVGQLSDSFK